MADHEPLPLLGFRGPPLILPMGGDMRDETMGDFSCNECKQTFATYYELRDHKAASHREEVKEKIVQRGSRAL